MASNYKISDRTRKRRRYLLSLHDTSEFQNLFEPSNNDDHINVSPNVNPNVGSEKSTTHLLLLIISLENLLCKNIEKKNLFIVEKYLIDFTKNLEIFYDYNIMTSGAHELLH
jgi:hypothetical protein